MDLRNIHELTWIMDVMSLYLSGKVHHFECCNSPTFSSLEAKLVSQRRHLGKTLANIGQLNVSEASNERGGAAVREGLFGHRVESL